MEHEAIKYYKVINDSLKVSQCFKTLITKDPTNFGLRVEKGDYFLGIGRLDKAIGCYSDALGLTEDPKKQATICDKIFHAEEVRDRCMREYSIKKARGEFYDYKAITKKHLEDDAILVSTAKSHAPQAAMNASEVSAAMSLSATSQAFLPISSPSSQPLALPLEQTSSHLHDLETGFVVWVAGAGGVSTDG